MDDVVYLPIVLPSLTLFFFVLQSSHNCSFPSYSCLAVMSPTEEADGAT